MAKKRDNNAANNRRHGTDLDVEVRRQRAWELRRAHATYEQIAVRLGIGVQTAYMDVRHVLEEFRARQHESVEHVVELESKRLDAMALALWPKVQKGSPEAVRAVVRVMERRARMLGLDAPERHEHTGAGGGPIQVQAALAVLDVPALQAKHAELVARLAAAEAQERERTQALLPGEQPAQPEAPPDTPEARAAAYARELAERAKAAPGNGGGAA